MATTATTKGATSSGTKPNTGKGASWAKQHRAVVILGVMAVVALWMLTRRSASSSSGTSTSGMGAATTADPYGLASMPYGPSAIDSGSGGASDPNSVGGLLQQLLAGQQDQTQQLLGAQAQAEQQAAGGLSAILAGQQGLGDTLNKILGRPGRGSTTKAKGGGHHPTSGHTKNSVKHQGQHQGHAPAPKPSTPKPKLGAGRQGYTAPPKAAPIRGSVATSRPGPTVAQRQAAARTPTKAAPARPERRR